MTVGMAKGTNAMGHLGWVTVRCRVCGIWLDLTGGAGRGRKMVAYACPRCSKTLEAFFCSPCAKKVKYTCPYCGTQLTPVTPLLEA
ncbi:MAG: hypothetical protein ACK4H7_03135 [Acidilobaceae archaeon]